MYLFPAYPARREDFHGTPDEQFFADRHYDLKEELENAKLTPQEQSRALEYWSSACKTIRQYGTSSKEAATAAYNATEKWGKNHPVAVGVGSLVVSTGIGTGVGLAMKS